MQTIDHFLDGLVAFLSPFKRFVLGIIGKTANHIMWRPSRAAAMGVFFILLSLFLIACGLLVIPVAIIVCAPWSAGVKLAVTLLVGIFYLFTGIALSYYIFREQRWKKMFGA